MRAAAKFYGQTMVIVAAGGIGGVITRNTREMEPQTTLLFDAVEICVTTLLWPIAVPIHAALFFDVRVNGATWTVSRKTKTYVSELSHGKQ